MQDRMYHPHTSKKQTPTGGGGSRSMDVLDVVIYNLPSKKNNIPKSSPTPHKTVISLVLPFLGYRLLRICYTLLMDNIIDIEECLSDDAIRFDGLDGAIVGHDHNGYLVYDYDLMVKIFMDEGMSGYEAAEWVDYNVVGVNAGNGFVIAYP